MMIRRVALLPLLVLLAAMTSLSASAQAGSDLKVQVTNGTPGGGPIAGLPITIYSTAGGQQLVAGAGRTDTQGAFSWTGAVGQVGASYVVSTTYAGVAYNSGTVTLPAPPVVLRVYETTSDDTNIRVVSAGLVIANVDAPTQRIQALESATFANSGNRTYLPTAAGARGPMGLLRFGLPDGAGNLTTMGQLSASNVIQVDTGFSSDMPLPPGNTDVSYAYEIAYGALSDGGFAQLNKALPYGADNFRLLAATGDFNIESPQLASDGSVVVGSRTYRQYSAKSLPANTQLSVDLINLPLIQPALRPGNPWLQVSIGILLLAAAALPFIYRRRYMHNALAEPQTEGDSTREIRAARRVRVPPIEKEPGV